MANQTITAEVHDLQLVVMPSYMPGLVRFFQDVAALAKPLLVEAFPDMPF